MCHGGAAQHFYILLCVSFILMSFFRDISWIIGPQSHGTLTFESWYAAEAAACKITASLTGWVLVSSLLMWEDGKIDTPTSDKFVFDLIRNHFITILTLCPLCIHCYTKKIWTLSVKIYFNTRSDWRLFFTGLKTSCVVRFVEDGFFDVKKLPPNLSVGSYFETSFKASSSKYLCEIVMIGGTKFFLLKMSTGQKLVPHSREKKKKKAKLKRWTHSVGNCNEEAEGGVARNAEMCCLINHFMTF